MAEKTLSEIADVFGLTVETSLVPDHPNAHRIFKGAKQIFIGTESAAREFLLNYENERPGLYEGSMYGYKE